MITQDHTINQRMMDSDKDTKDFVGGIYIEHLEEASFLYVQRVNLLKEPSYLWPDLENTDQRIKAHIMALALGGDKALEICHEQSGERNPGILYTVVRVICYHKKDDWLKEILDGLDPGDMDRVNTVIDALNHGLPVEWYPMIEQMLLSPHPFMIHMALAVIAYRRIPMEDALMDLLNKPHDETFGLIIRTLGCLRVKQARDYLSFLNVNDQEPDFIKQELCMALLRLRKEGAVPVPADRRSVAPWVYQAMGLSGGASHVSYLKEISQSDAVCDESLLALGFLGDASSVDILMSYLIIDGPYSETSSLALNLITGADLYEDVFIPDPVNEDTLFPDELEKFRRGEPIYPPGREPGDTINRLSQNPMVWKAWWQTHAFGFDSEVTYRHGTPYAPSGILKTLASEKSPALIRQLAYEEFVIRYDQDFCFDVTLPVSDQRNILHIIKKWIGNNGFES